MNFIKKLFRRKDKDDVQPQDVQNPQPLCIEGTTLAPLTPEPDDAELAAQALLEMMCDGRGKMEDVSHQSSAINHQTSAISHQPKELTAEYYKQLADRMMKLDCQARDQATLRTMRIVAWCEQELKKRDLPTDGKGPLQQMEVELFKHLDTVERVGGELKVRWQHCLAKVIVRQMPSFS